MIEILERLIGKTFGKDGSLTESDVRKLSQRESLSNYLPYLYYNEEKKAFLNIDNTYGYCFECSPLGFYTPKQMQRMKKLLESKMPDRTVIQVTLIADKHIKPMLDEYIKCKTRDNILAKKCATEYANHLLNGVDNFPQTGFPIRNFITLFSIKSPEPLLEHQITLIEETLKSTGLYANRMTGNDLTVFLRRFLNGKENQDVSDKYSPLKPIRKQLIDPETQIKFPANSPARIGKKFAACLTQLTSPESTSVLTENKLVGGFMGIEDDGNQLITPFMITLNITFEGVEEEVSGKAKIMIGQGVVGKKAVELNKRVNEIHWINSLSDTKLAKVQYCMWIFANSESELQDSVSRAKRIATDADYELREETLLKSILFISALPFGLYNLKNNVTQIDRYTILPAESIAAILPVQADYSGAYRITNGKIPEGQRPILLNIGRKGQIQAFDVFDERSNNHNILITAGSGAGKSFNLGKLVNDYYASGAKVRCVDIGYSLQKTCSMNGGRFIDLGTEEVIINPFDTKSVEDKDDREGNFNTTVNVLSEMVYSSSGDAMSEIENTLMSEAVRYTIKTGNVVNGVDCIQDYLYNFKEKAKNLPIVEVREVLDIAKKMAFNITSFTTNGPYGKYFNGRSTFDISNDDFVVLELQQLKEVKDLFSVMTMQVVNAVTQDLYLSNRKDQRFVLFEEAAHYLKQQGHRDLVRLAEIIEEGYRRARKHYGSFGAVLQSILDLNYFGSVGKVLKSNAEYKFFMYSEDYGEAAATNLINHNGLSLDLLESIKNNKPRYSELMMENPRSIGCSRLAIDKWNYWVNTSSGKEVFAYNELIKAGYRPEEAISRLSGIPL
ncbi:MAG: TraC family protein [Colwellia sp.]|jgi:F pilus assembly Type-IV secretion system for plasmid transfer.